jgi:hypothetical protein
MIQTRDIGKIRLEIEQVPEIRFPSAADCNSPCWWQGGQLYVLTSTGHPIRSSGKGLDSLAVEGKITYTAYRDGGRWIEAVYPAEDGTLFGWYHNEPAHLVPPEMHEGRQFPMTAPFIGAVVSYDNGEHWDDLGLIIVGSPETLNLEAPNFWFAGGNGDFTVILDREKAYFYFVFGSYYKDTKQQGIALARMAARDLHSPVGKVMKWHEGGYHEPGLNGQLTPILPVQGDWYGPTPDAFWGPSVHWNCALDRYVILLNRAIDRNWKQEGIYVCFAEEIGNPETWSTPARMLDETGWYPQVIGCDEALGETDREAGSCARLFIHGVSKYRLHFSLSSE